MTNNQNSSWNSSPFSSKKQFSASRIMNFILPSNYILILQHHIAIYLLYIWGSKEKNVKAEGLKFVMKILSGKRMFVQKRNINLYFLSHHQVTEWILHTNLKSRSQYPWKLFVLKYSKYRSELLITNEILTIEIPCSSSNNSLATIPSLVIQDGKDINKDAEHECKIQPILQGDFWTGR